jgi:hypothetical protein
MSTRLRDGAIAALRARQCVLRALAASHPPRPVSGAEREACREQWRFAG